MENSTCWVYLCAPRPLLSVNAPTVSMGGCSPSLFYLKAVVMFKISFVEKLLARASNSTNAPVVVKHKCEEKAAPVVNTVQLNPSCAYKACPFRVRAVENFSYTLCFIFGETWACKMHSRKCHWAIHFPAPL